jgi:acylphosphatase
MKTLRVYISGTVQGILFRKFIEENANRIGVRGFVRNLDDGRVEAVFEGTDDKVMQMLEICKIGNPHSKIREVRFQEIPNQSFVGFKIMRI